ncbi:MAG: hypothetical protein ACK5L6_03775 [Anaerorhabdus sp.]|uniref:hypothetical protein n=1 Tax=Anaerorhabdus sp. TaxID=1872524 RepID=UPI003A8A1EA0
MTKIKKIFCVLFGHSNIVENCFGYRYCSRCGEQVGDSLGGNYYNPKEVIVGHNCDVCRENYKKMSWKDKFLCPNPFK